MMKKLKAFAGDGSCLFADILILNIHLAKKLFILELSLGDSIKIPPTLLQDWYSMSYRYYDPIIRLA